MSTRAQTLYDALVGVRFPFEHAGVTIEAASELVDHDGRTTVEHTRVVGNVLILVGHGGLNDPGTADDSWVWHIVNPPLGVRDGDEVRVDPIAALREIIEGML